MQEQSNIWQSIYEIGLHNPSIDRSTLLKAAQRGNVPAEKRGRYWYVAVSSPKYQHWYADYFAKARVQKRVNHQFSEDTEIAPKKS